MNAGTDSIFRLRTACILSLVLFALVLTLAAPISAQSTHWPTTKWVVMDEQGGDLTKVPYVGNELDVIAAMVVPPVGERADLADKHREILEAASIWYQSLGFSAPVQLTEDYNLEVEPGEAYRATLKRSPVETGSDHNAAGRMRLTSNTGFLSADTPYWMLMKASAVHELYHGIQDAANPSLVAANEARPTKLPECPGDTNLDWLIEGTAAMVQVRWLERTDGVSWGHPFKGSHRAAWVRHFDQSLQQGSLPPEHRNPGPRPEMTSMETVSWACDYGTWYFWYAVGDMIGRNNAEKVAYTRYLFNAGNPWDDGGVANVDVGLKAAAAAYNAIGPYRGGLYDLYPQFVAQYLAEDRFYADLEKVELGAPGLYETTSSLSGGPLESLASRAWRVRVQLPQDVSSIPYKVRFTLDAPDGTDRDDLHLIVDDAVIGRPAGSTVPYTDVKQINATTAAADGSVEYLVRVANVAKDAAETGNAEFSLRVEVEGFYGNKVSDDSKVSGGPSASQISGELPPGFDMRGPGPWSCSGNATSKAIFDLVTPDEMGRDIDRVFPESSRSLDNMLDNAAIKFKQMQQQGQIPGMTQEQLAALRQRAQAQFAAGRAEVEAGDKSMGARADEARAARMTGLAATFVGRDDGQECQLTLRATLAGRQGGAQILAMAVDDELYPEDDAPSFEMIAYRAEVLQAMQSLRPLTQDPLHGWEICAMTDKRRRDVQKGAHNGCPAVTCTAGKLTLEQAEQGRIAGTFQFDVIRWPENAHSGCRVPSERGTVVGHFNVSSTDDGYDDNSLGAGAGLKGGMMMMPGMPILNLLPAIKGDGGN